MTGEMHESEVTRENFPLYFAIAAALGGEVKPFDQYQGPYVLIGPDVRVGTPPYAVAPVGLGVVRLWLCTDDGVESFVYNEANDKKSEPFLVGQDETEQAVAAARSVI